MNTIIFTGVVVTPPVVDHVMNGETMYRLEVQSMRSSGVNDVAVVMLPARLGIDTSKLTEGAPVAVEGQIRMRKLQDKETGKWNFLMFVFARAFAPVTESEIEEFVEENSVTISGKVARTPVVRSTPNGRNIADVHVLVDRGSYNKIDRIPCILWGVNAIQAVNFQAGDEVVFEGRLQSRIRFKKDADGNDESYLVNEVSVSRFAMAEDLVEETAE